MREALGCMKLQFLLFFFYYFVLYHVNGKELVYTSMEDDVSRKMQKACTGAMPAGEVIVSPPGVVLTKNFRNYAQRILDLDVRESDIWVISFPKSGTTWAQEMVWLLKNKFNFKTALEVYLYERFPFLEYKALNAEGNTEPDGIDIINKMISPRLIKTHLPVELLPKQIWTKNPKIIYLTRNPKDVALSYCHHYRIWNNYKDSQELFLQAFLENKVVVSPYWNHVLSYWKLHKQGNNFLHIAFEDMKKDLAMVLKEVALFLNVIYEEVQEPALLDHLSFKKMKNNKAVNFEDDFREMNLPPEIKFMREGNMDGWKSEMSPEFIKQFDEWTNKNLEGSDFPRKYC